MAFKNIDKLIFKYMKKRKMTQRTAAKLVGVKPQTFHKYKEYGIPEKYYIDLIKVLTVPSKHVVEALKQDFRV